LKKGKVEIPSYPDPPDHLSDRAKDLWCQIGPSRADTVGRRTMLQAALECLDRADAARRAIESDGLFTTTKTTGAIHAHPGIIIEKESMARWAKLWAALGANWTAEALWRDRI
jgi:hypothetical protein